MAARGRAIYRSNSMGEIIIKISLKCQGTLRAVRVGPRLKDEAFVAFAAGDVLAVEEFQQGDGVLARDACPLFEGGDVEALRFAGGEQVAEFVDRGAVEDEIVIDAGEALFAKQKRQQGARARGLDAGFREHLRDRRDGEAGVFEGALDRAAGVLFVLLEGDFVARGCGPSRLRPPAPSRRRAARREGTAGQSGSSRARRSCFGDAGQQRMRGMEIADGAHQAVARGLIPGRVDVPLAAGERFQRTRAAISLGCRPVRATRSSRLSPNADSRTSSARRAAVFGPARTSRRAAALSRLAIAALADIDHDAAADGHHGREHADDEAVAGEQQRGVAEDDARVGGGAGLERGASAEQADFGLDLGGPGVEVDGRAVLQRARGGRAGPAGNRGGARRGSGRARRARRRARSRRARYRRG